MPLASTIFGLVPHSRDGAIFAHASDVRLQHSALCTAGNRFRGAPSLVRSDWARPVKWPFVIFAYAARITGRSARHAPDLS